MGDKASVQSTVGAAVVVAAVVMVGRRWVVGDRVQGQG